jgi:hypothetical protein
MSLRGGLNSFSEMKKCIVPVYKQIALWRRVSALVLRLQMQFLPVTVALPAQMFPIAFQLWCF